MQIKALYTLNSEQRKRHLKLMNETELIAIHLCEQAI